MSDSDIGGDEEPVASPGAAGNAAAAVRKRGAGRATQRDSAGCFLCSEPILHNQNPKKLKGLVFHGVCHAAVRCFRRQAQTTGGSTLAKKTDEMMLSGEDEAVEEWRAGVLPLVDDGSGRNSGDRARARKKVEEYVEYEDKATIRDIRKLTKIRFKSYKKMWEQQESDDASEEFDKLHAEQEGCYDTQRDERVGVEDDEIDRIQSGTRESTGKITRKAQLPRSGRNYSPPASQRGRPMSPKSSGKKEGRGSAESSAGRPASKRDGTEHDSEARVMALTSDNLQRLKRKLSPSRAGDDADTLSLAATLSMSAKRSGKVTPLLPT